MLFQSSAIHCAEYDADAKELTIEFVKGKRAYTYYGVPPEVWAGLCDASSAGDYFQFQIKPVYGIR